MGEDGHEEDGGVSEEGLDDATVPARDEAKQQAGEEHGGKDCCYHWIFVARGMPPAGKRRGQRKPFPKKREKAGSKDEQEPWSNRGKKR